MGELGEARNATLGRSGTSNLEEEVPLQLPIWLPCCLPARPGQAPWRCGSAVGAQHVMIEMISAMISAYLMKQKSGKKADGTSVSRYTSAQCQFGSGVMVVNGVWLAGRGSSPPLSCLPCFCHTVGPISAWPPGRLAGQDKSKSAL